MRILTSLLLATTLFATNGYHKIGVGVKSRGMGGIGVAYPVDSFAIAANPAGIAELGNRVDLGFEWIMFDAHARFRDTDVDDLYRSTKSLYWPEAGALYRSFGLAIYSLGGWHIDYGEAVTQLGSQSDTKSTYQVYMVSPAWACKINRCHSIGIALNIGLAWFDLGGMEAFIPNQGTDNAQGVGFRIGWIGHLNRCWSVGATWQSPTWMSRFRKYRNFIADHGRLSLPSQWGLATTWHWPCFAFSLELTRLMYNDVRFFNNDQRRLGPYGAINGPGLGWKDQWVVKAGGEWKLNRLTLRAGWNYGNIQYANLETRISTFNMAQVEHHFTAGGTYKWGCNEISAYYVLGLLHNLAHFEETLHDKQKTWNHSAGIAYARLF